MTATPQEIVETYAAAWCEPEEPKRRALLERSWTDGGTYTDPQSDASGRDALIALIGGFHQQQPGARIEPASTVDVNHNRLRFAWRMVAANGATVIDGLDYGELDNDGRIRKIVGFFGPLA